MANVTTLDDVVSEGLAARRLPMTLMLAFGALVLCAAVALAVPVRRATRADPAASMR